MFAFILKRLLEAIPALFIIISLNFFLIRLAPGDPFLDEKTKSAEVQTALNEHYGLDKPIWQQYLRYLGNLVQGDLGPSFKYPGWSVNELILEKLLISLELGIYALLVAASIGISAGVLASLRPNSWLDRSLMSSTMLGICLPSFVLGPLLILAFAVYLNWFNVAGWFLPSDRILPSFTLGIIYAAYIARIMRGSMLEVHKACYIRTARAKGLSPARIVLVHSLRNGILPVIAFLGPTMAGLISGSFVVETIFNIPGLGKFFVNSAFNRDYTMMMGMVLFYATVLILFNLLSDIVQAWLNPRQKIE